MSERKWQFIPRNRAMSVLYLVAGVLLVVSDVAQLRDGVSILPIVSAVLALALICLACLGLVRSTSASSSSSSSTVRRR
ncbi:hypothetical protein ACIRPX_45550 [Streptomyces sp. NPDC101225]|uniref:hypothetical protein n=1 Tax=Streptomyces sp. NPDC101225 TaxID=3366135 RepID=UPI0038224806